MDTVGLMRMPDDFKYRDVFLRGKPQHKKYDSFSLRHPKMDTGKRAKIFSPFDALRGFSAALIAKDVRYENRLLLEEADRDELDRRLRILRELTRGARRARENRVAVSVTYYEPCADEDSDSYEIRGQYRTVSGVCRGVDSENTRQIEIGREKISFEDILSIESDQGIFAPARGSGFRPV